METLRDAFHIALWGTLPLALAAVGAGAINTALGKMLGVDDRVVFFIVRAAALAVALAFVLGGVWGELSALTVDALARLSDVGHTRA